MRHTTGRVPRGAGPHRRGHGDHRWSPRRPPVRPARTRDGTRVRRTLCGATGDETGQ